MLCPEISNFEAPDCSFQVQKLDDEKYLNQNIDYFYYNHLLSVIIPDTLVVPEKLTEKLIFDCDYYKVFDLNLTDIIDLKFLCSFVKTGTLTLLSVNTRIDCDNCIGITPTGYLILSVDKDTYQSLGLEGRVSHFTAKIKNRYVIKINLKEECLRPGNPKYVKIKSRLETLGKFTVIVLWEPPADDICPSSLAKYFFDNGYQVKTCMPTFNTNTLYSVKVPDVDFASPENENFDFVEWLGMLSVGGDLECELPNFLSTFETPSPNKEIGQVKHLQWKGIFSTKKIKEFIKDLREYSKEMHKPWIAVYVQGFSDSPVAWREEEHHYYTNGDNGYICIFNGATCLFCIQKCCQKRYK